MDQPINFDLGQLKEKAESFRESGDYKQAVKSYSFLIEACHKEKDAYNLYKAYFDLGKIYEGIFDYKSSLEAFLNALATIRPSNDLNLLFEIHIELAGLYQSTRSFALAIDNFNQALSIANKLNDREKNCLCLYSLGNVYNWNEEYDKSKDYLVQATKASAGFPDIAVKVFGSLGILYTKTNKLSESYNYFERSLELCNTGKEGLKAGLLKSFGNLLLKMKQPERALEVLLESLNICNKLNLRSTAMLSHGFLADTYESLGDYKNAFYHQKKNFEIERELTQEEVEIKTRGLQLRFDMEEARKEMEIFRLKNVDLEKANHEIEIHKRQLEERNKDITDSIRYALRIQQAILPSEENIKGIFNDGARIFFKPRDIVSGDFYWVHDTGKEVIIAIADCTGHGVPGAFMSFIGYNLLNKIVVDLAIEEPGKILNCLNNQLIELLKQNTRGNAITNDGMDIAICRIKKKNPFNIHFASANRPLIVSDKEGVKIIKGSKRSIGERMDADFEQKLIHAIEGSVLFLFSDGITDQFGGSKNKKLTVKKLEALLDDLRNYDLNSQFLKIEDFMDNWQSNQEQTDDMLLFALDTASLSGI